MTDPRPDPRPDVDALLRTTLRDDLPSDVEDLLNDRVETFLARRAQETRRPLNAVADWLLSVPGWIPAWPVGRAFHAAAAIALVACGLMLQAAGGAGVLAASVARVKESAAVWEAISRAASMRCAGAAQDDLGSPASFAARYRHWILVASTIDARRPAILLTYTSPADGAHYELTVDRRSMLPRRVVKTVPRDTTPPGGVAAGYDAGCSWESRERDYGHE